MFVVSLNYKVPLTAIDRLQAAHVEWLKAGGRSFRQGGRRRL